MMTLLINILQTDFCMSSAGYRIFGFVGYILKFIHIFIPIIIIVMGSIDFLKALIAQDNSVIKKSQNMFIKRLILGVCVFFVFSIVSFVITLANGNSKYSSSSKNICLWSFSNPNEAMKLANNTTNITNNSVITNENDCINLGVPYIWKDNNCQIDVSDETLE